MASLKPFEVQQQIKENSQGIVKQINELHKWEKDIKRKTAAAAANCQTKKNEVSFCQLLFQKNSFLYFHFMFVVFSSIASDDAFCDIFDYFFQTI